MPGPSSQAPPSFINKPARGWLHPDHLFARDGINYAVRYIGCMEVTTSMKVLDFDTRSAIAKECISRVCEDANMKGVDRRRVVDRGVTAMLGEAPVLVRAGTNVQLTITSVCLRLSDLDNGAVIHQHEMPNISFASGGDSDTLDYIAYVAKESPESARHSGPPVPARACYVLECGGGLAQDVITTIGQAFELRFKEFLKRTPSNRPPPLPPLHHHPPIHPDDPEYYNDLPDQAPPHNSGSSNSNLIDLSTELPGARGGEAEYMNSQVQDQRHNKSHHDPFDMSPFALAPPGGGIPSPVTPTPVQTPLHRAQLAKEDWFHGPISRKDAEAKLRNDGDFLVRESQGSPGQYVLTGMQGAIRKHLLLVDPEGVVRTKDRAFDNVSHLINFHRHNSLPIISAESALRLQHPVSKSQR